MACLISPAFTSSYIFTQASGTTLAVAITAPLAPMAIRLTALNSSPVSTLILSPTFTSSSMAWLMAAHSLMPTRFFISRVRRTTVSGSTFTLVR